MKHLIVKGITVVALVAALAVPLASPAFASGNPSPSGTGPPSQSCQAEPSSPGNAASSPGSPFNEPSATSSGGTGGQNYSATSQYDVACYQVSHH